MKSLFLLLIVAFIPNCILAQTWFRDVDSDYFGDPGNSKTGTSNPGGYVLNSLDCNDNVKNDFDWQFIGVKGFSAGIALQSGLTRDAFGKYYVMYNDFLNSNNISVMKYTGTTWTLLGAAGFVDGVCDDIIVDNSSAPYVVGRASGQLQLYKFNGTVWTSVGIVGPSANMGHIRLTIGGNVPYILYSDYFGTGKLTVKKFNGSFMSNVGGTNFTTGLSVYNDIKVNASGTPYVSFANSAHSDRICVMKFDGSSWVYVGSPGFSQGAAAYTQLAFDASGTPYVFYVDGGKGLVKKFDGTNWTDVGAQGVGPSGFSDQTRLVIGKSGVPVVGTFFTKAKLYWFDGINWILNTRDSINGGSMVLDDMDIPVIVYGDISNGQKTTVAKVIRKPLAPHKPNLQTPLTIITEGQNVSMTVDVSDKLNDAAYWEWYAGSCGGTPIGTGISLTDTPKVNTTYYARGVGGCAGAAGACDSLQITVNPVAISNLRGEEESVSVYPNPASDYLILSNAEKNSLFTLQSVSGQVVVSGIIVSDKHSIDVRGIAKGVYFLSVRNVRGIPKVYRVNVN